MIYELNDVELRDYVKSYKRKSVISSVEDEVPNKIYLKNIPRSKRKLLKYLSNYGVIGGSMALKLYGVLQRSVRDIDLMCDDSGYTYLKTVHREYGKYDIYHSFSPLFKYHVACLSIGKHNIVNMRTDIFIKQNINYIDFDGIKLQPLNEIINEKAVVMRIKDKNDLKEILSRIESNQYIVKTNRNIFRRIFETLYTTV